MDEIQTLKSEIDKLTIQANEDMITILRLRAEINEERLVKQGNDVKEAFGLDAFDED